MITIFLQKKDGFARTACDLDFIISGGKVFLLENTSRMTTGRISKRDGKIYVNWLSTKYEPLEIEVRHGKPYDYEVCIYPMIELE